MSDAPLVTSLVWHDDGRVSMTEADYHQLRDARTNTTDLIDELDKADKIIGIALNCLTSIEAQQDKHGAFVQRVVAAGLEGDGITRHHERTAVLARSGAVR